MPILSSKVLYSSREEFDQYLRKSKASPDSKARYTRAWKEAHEKQTSGSKRTVSKEVPKEKGIPSRTGSGNTSVKAVKPDTTVKKKYVIGEKRLNVDYKKAKEDFAKLEPKTQQRYWRAWQQYREDHVPAAQKEHPEYRAILSYNVIIDGDLVTDEHGKPLPFHWSAIVNKKRLSKKEIEALAEEIKLSTDVKIINVKPQIMYDNYTGRQI